MKKKCVVIFFNPAFHRKSLYFRQTSGDRVQKLEENQGFSLNRGKRNQLCGCGQGWWSRCVFCFWGVFFL